MRTPHITLCLLGLLLLAGCSAEAKVRSTLKEANHCETKDDCVLIGSKCPFDCYVYVHKSEADRVKPILDAYESDCTYSCVATLGVECRENVCVALTEQPPAEKPNGNVGADCTQDIECETPMEYLTRSVCAYRSFCIGGQCAVGCPLKQSNGTDPIACRDDSDCTCENYAPDDLENCTCVNNQCVVVVE